MQTYEINLWKDKIVVEKIVKQFDNDDQVLEYIQNNFDTDPTPNYPGMDPERGYIRPKASDYIITWSQVNTYVRKKGPKRIELTEEEKEIQKTLEASITKEAIDEWGEREMLNQVRQDYWSNPDATGLEDKK
jgi:hypothetical protein|tara:strand:+ start:1138 stop:1533 length:396 start_codon:yes stop_codon:yes gene_type:complete